MNAPCASCPFLRENFGKRHKSGWYRIANIRRLWNGLRTGEAPGMVCHSTDPRAIEYGGERQVAPGHERECIGANTLVQRELTALGAAESFREYRRERPRGLTRLGAASWVHRAIFQNTPLGRPIVCGDVNDQRIQHP